MNISKHFAVRKWFLKTVIWTNMQKKEKKEMALKDNPKHQWNVANMIDFKMVNLCTHIHYDDWKILVKLRRYVIFNIKVNYPTSYVNIQFEFSGSVAMGFLGSWEPINFWIVGSGTHQSLKEGTKYLPFQFKRGKKYGLRPWNSILEPINLNSQWSHWNS